MSQNSSYLAPIMDETTGEQAKDKAGNLLFEEKFGLHPDTPEPAPSVGVRRVKRPGEEHDLEDERAVAERLRAQKAKEAELDNREKSLATQAEAMKLREAKMGEALKAAGLSEAKIAEALKKAGIEPSK